ncbi:MFS transporter [Streptomyces sp. V2]|uniref:MFS transporter n=1 Tax=Streptomyces niveiscabiei TaxID=164115 RepID=A0ABW9HRZ0_9ACTN|nr:MFS transporter [Streptomyces sp. V2]
MPHVHQKPPHTPRNAPETLYTTTADTLVAVDFTPRTLKTPKTPRKPRSTRTSRPAHPTTPGPYRRLLSHPGARAFTAGNLVARLPSGMFSVSALMMIADAHGSYALAGAVTATGLAATAVAAPWIARLIDRRGQAQVAVPAALFAALGSIALVLCVRYDAPPWTLFAAYAATATTPNTGGMSRARWAHLLAGDDEALHTANSFEQAADELCFLLGPLLAALLCANVFPEAGTLVAAVLLVTGILLFAAQRRTEPPPHAHPSTRSPLTAPGMPPLLAACLCLGAVFGATEVVTVAFADEAGHRAAAGLVLGLQAGGSALAGLAFGALTGHGEEASGKDRRTSRTGTPSGKGLQAPRPGAASDEDRQTPKAGAASGKSRQTPRSEPAPGTADPVENKQTPTPPPNSSPAARRYPWCIAAMATLLTLPLLAATLTGSLPLLALTLLIAGAATAPTMITGMTLVQQRTPEGRLNEGMTLAVTGLLGGIATGSALGGWVADHAGPTTGYGVPLAAACTALLVTLTWQTGNPGHTRPTTTPNAHPTTTS